LVQQPEFRSEDSFSVTSRTGWFGRIGSSIKGVLFGLLLTVVISFFVISVAWIIYRPLIGIPLILVAGVGLFLLVKKLVSQKKRQEGLAPS